MKVNLEGHIGLGGYDIIGDVHGCANTLVRLLEKLNYCLDDEGCYRHDVRKAIFVGDIIDRGPRIREALAIVRSMVDAGNAYCILGNHEFNAVAYTTEISRDAYGTHYLRAHDRRNNRLIQETLVQFASYPEEWRLTLEWLKRLPLFLEFEGFRVVHACWDRESICEIRQLTGKEDPVLNDVLPLLVAGSQEATRCLDRITRGTNLRYPNGRYVESRDGIKRDFFRTKFWAHEPQTYQDVVFQPDPLPENLVDRDLSDAEKQKLVVYPHESRPVFFGHYWLQGRPKVQRKNLACLDYSAVKFGRLCAYSYDGEKNLSNDKFNWVYVDPNVKEVNDS